MLLDLSFWWNSAPVVVTPPVEAVDFFTGGGSFRRVEPEDTQWIEDDDLMLIL